MIIKDINLEKLITELENNAWNGKEPQQAFLFNQNNVIEIYAYTYEPCYEMFSTTHSIKINGKELIVNNCREGIETLLQEIKHINEYLKEQEFSISYKMPNSIMTNVNEESVDYEEMEEI